MFGVALIWIWILTMVGPGSNQLIRPVPIYQDIILGIHDYFNNTCIILLHATADPIGTQGLAEGMQLASLLAFLSGRHIRTTSMDFETFKRRVGYNFYHIKRPLFVLLNDHDDVKYDFTHVTGWIDMSYPTWLIFFRDETRIDDFFTGIYVPFDCTFMVAQGDADDPATEIITEVYQIDRKTKIRRAKFGSWHPHRGITVPKLGLYQRRNDLFGHTLRVTSIHDPPGSLIVRDDDGKVVDVGGFFGGIIKLLQEAMNCTITYHESHNWGYRSNNGTWTGAIGMLTGNEVDIVAAELMMTPDRISAVDFTTPLYSTKCRAFIKRPLSSPFKWEAYITPFDSGIWNSIAVLIVVTSATISIAKLITSVMLTQIRDVENSPSNSSDIMLAVFGALCSQGMDQSLLDPIRIIHQVIHLTGVVVLAAYSAALISSLTINTLSMPFTTMEGLLEDGTYRFGVVGGSADYSFFQNTSDKVLEVLFDEILTKEIDLPNNYLDGLNRVCEEENYAFMTLDNVVAQLQPVLDCKVEPLDTIMQSSIAMAVGPRNPYRGLINANILLIRDSGILQRLLNAEWMITNTKLDSGWTTVEIFDVLPLILVVLGGTFFSLAALASEQLIARRIEKMGNIRKKITKRTEVQSRIRLKLRIGATGNLSKF